MKFTVILLTAAFERPGFGRGYPRPKWRQPPAQVATTPGPSGDPATPKTWFKLALRLALREVRKTPSSSIYKDTTMGGDHREPPPFDQGCGERQHTAAPPRRRGKRLWSNVPGSENSDPLGQSASFLGAQPAGFAHMQRNALYRRE